MDATTLISRGLNGSGGVNVTLMVTAVTLLCRSFCRGFCAFSSPYVLYYLHCFYCLRDTVHLYYLKLRIRV